MPCHSYLMKDVPDCEKLREAVKEAMKRRCPNGETRLGSYPVIRKEKDLAN